MPAFSIESLRKLNECDHHLVILFTEVIKHRDCKILDGRRGEELQNRYFAEGKSKVRYPRSKHNTLPLSMAVDVAPYFTGSGVSLNRYEVVEFGHYVLGFRDAMNLTNRIRWGGDWNRNWKTLTDKEFLDAFHWEVIGGA